MNLVNTARHCASALIGNAKPDVFMLFLLMSSAVNWWIVSRGKASNVDCSGQSCTNDVRKQAALDAVAS
jgi:hypothetical protein